MKKKMYLSVPNESLTAQILNVNSEYLEFQTGSICNDKY